MKIKHLLILIGIPIAPLVDGAPIFVPSDPILGGKVVGTSFQVGAVGTAPSGERNVWPSAEGPANAIDGFGQKYLNFGRENSGILVTPGAGATVARRMKLWTANDQTSRDPVSYHVYGKNGPIGTAPYALADFELISSGRLNPPLERTLGGTAPLTDATAFYADLGNEAAYTSYLIYFPEVREPLANYAYPADSFQIAEIQLDTTAPDFAVVSTLAASQGVAAGAGTGFTLSTAGTGFDCKIGLYDVSGTLLAQGGAVGNGGTASVSLPSGLPIGTYYVALVDASAEIGTGFSVVHGPGDSPGGSWSLSAESGGSPTLQASGAARSDEIVWLSIGVSPDPDSSVGFIAFTNDAVTIDTEAAAFDTEIALFSPSGELLATDDNSGLNMTSRIDFTASAPGTYYVAVTGTGATFASGFQATPGTAFGTWDLGVFGRSEGIIGGPMASPEIVWVTFEVVPLLQLGGLALVEAPLAIDTDGSDITPVLAVYDGFGDLVSTGSPGGGLSLPSGLAAGTYYLVLGASGATFDTGFQVAGGAESGDYFLNLPGFSLSDTLKSGGTDWASFEIVNVTPPLTVTTLTASGGGIVDISLIHPQTNFDTEIGLYDRFGQLLATNDDSGGGLASRLAFQSVPPDTYYLAVGRWNTDYAATDFGVVGTSASTTLGTFRLTVNDQVFDATQTGTEVVWVKMVIEAGDIPVVDVGIADGVFFIEFTGLGFSHYLLEEVTSGAAVPVRHFLGVSGTNRVTIPVEPGRHLFRVNDITLPASSSP